MRNLILALGDQLDQQSADFFPLARRTTVLLSMKLSDGTRRARTSLPQTPVNARVATAGLSRNARQMERCPSAASSSGAHSSADNQLVSVRSFVGAQVRMNGPDRVCSLSRRCLRNERDQELTSIASPNSSPRRGMA
jgi:hypothetical protein